MLCHDGAIFISESHDLPENKDPVNDVLVLKHYVDLLLKDICLGLFIKVVI